MERMITNLFDFQRFKQNTRLENIIQDAEGRYDNALCDDDLEWVSAAGDVSDTTLESQKVPYNGHEIVQSDIVGMYQ